MKNKHVCPKCGGTGIVGPHRVSGQSVVRVSLPSRTASLVAYTCSDCGYTELYSDSKGLENIRKYDTFLQPSSESQQSRASCPLCGTPVRPGMTTCPECGYDLTQ
jgi:predicted nucleic-acid-binding Zn-ribbon protein